MNIAYLREQLDKLYGPIFIILIHSQGVQEIQNKTLKPTHAIGEKASNMEELAPFIKMTEILNENHAEIIKNFDKITEIVKENFSLIDVSDIIVFDVFLKNYANAKLIQNGNGKIPDAIHKILEEGMTMPENFYNTITMKFIHKKNQLIGSLSTSSFQNIRQLLLWIKSKAQCISSKTRCLEA